VAGSSVIMRLILFPAFLRCRKCFFILDQEKFASFFSNRPRKNNYFFLTAKFFIYFIFAVITIVTALVQFLSKPAARRLAFKIGAKESIRSEVNIRKFVDQTPQLLTHLVLGVLSTYIVRQVVALPTFKHICVCVCVRVVVVVVVVVSLSFLNQSFIHSRPKCLSINHKSRSEICSYFLTRQRINARVVWDAILFCAAKPTGGMIAGEMIRTIPSWTC
jgi:hypothetical protein